MARRILQLLAIATLGLLAGCVREQGPAPFETHTRDFGPSTVPQAQIPHPDTVIVASGDTLYEISKRYGVPMRSVIEANRLQPPYGLRAGARLSLPQIRTHMVRPGDTLYSVARLYGVDTSTLAATNHLAAPFVIRSGEALVLPAAVEKVAAAPPSAPIASAILPPPAAPRPLPAPPHARPNGPPPAPAAAATVPPPPATGVAGATAAPAAASPPKPDDKVAALPPAAAVAPRGEAAPEKAFLWPVQGRIIGTFGSGPGGTHNDGINIAAPAGTPVLAADAGIVAYAGNELRGYGNLILIKHDNGYITAYAHNSSLLVKRGDRVTRGQQIAKVGATGAVSEPQLHFEVREGVRVVDPNQFLPAPATATSG
jgi:murein DD-endopeptidase MepM/ murein hydrolase activator NlpD